MHSYTSKTLGITLHAQTLHALALKLLALHASKSAAVSA